MRGGFERNQLHGWYQWDYGRVFIGGAHPGAAHEPETGIHGGFVSGGGDSVGTGVLRVQFPGTGKGEMLCRRCGKRGHCLYHAVCHRAAGDEDGGCDLADIPTGIWGGRVSDHRAPYLAAREFGAGTPQACLPIDGERAEDEPCEGFAAVYGLAVGCVAGIYLRLSGYCRGALVVSAECRGGAGCGLCAVQEEVLSLA